jgi:hypothetical protein
MRRGGVPPRSSPQTSWMISEDNESSTMEGYRDDHPLLPIPPPEDRGACGRSSSRASSRGGNRSPSPVLSSTSTSSSAAPQLSRPLANDFDSSEDESDSEEDINSESDSVASVTEQLPAAPALSAVFPSELLRGAQRDELPRPNSARDMPLPSPLPGCRVYVERTTYSRSSKGDVVRDTLKWSYVSSDVELDLPTSAQRSPVHAKAHRLSPPPARTATASCSPSTNFTPTKRPMSASMATGGLRPKPYISPSLQSSRSTLVSSDSDSDEIIEQRPDAPAEYVDRHFELKTTSLDALERLTQRRTGSAPSYATRYRGSVRNASKINVVSALPPKRHQGWTGSDSEEENERLAQ